MDRTKPLPIFRPRRKNARFWCRSTVRTERSWRCARAAMPARIARFKHLPGIPFADKLPRNALGDILRRRLRERPR